MSTVVEMFQRQVRERADRAALRTKAAGEWIARSWSEWDETSLAVAAGLIALGMKPGERVGLMCGTRREWAEIDLGILRAGAVTVPIYPQCTPGSLAEVLRDADCTVLFVDDPGQIEKVFDPRVRDGGRPLRRVIYLDAHRRLERPDARGRLEVRLEDVVPRAERANVMPFGTLLESGAKLVARDEAKVRARGDAVEPESLASIVYTSGTSGAPKGVCLTHANFVAEVRPFAAQLQLTPSDEQLLFLPLAHIFARVLLLGAIDVGCVTTFASSPSRALDELSEVHPTFFGAVPRVFEKIYASSHARVRDESPFRRRVAEAAFAVGRRVSELRQHGKAPGRILGAQYEAASLAVLERVRHRFGRRLRFALSGGAPLAENVARWLHACGVLVLEGYGLTETTAATHVNRPDAYRFGSVGMALPGIETRIAEDGEVLVRGPVVMAGYYKRDDETRAVTDADGWLHTGDVGSIDGEGYLTITDRKKDLIVTAGGKNVAPQNVEALLREEDWIAEAAVFGDKRPYLVALIAIDVEKGRAWARAQGLDLPRSELTSHAAVRGEIDRAIARVNAKLEPYQQVRRWAPLAGDALRADSGVDGAKLRRRAIGQHHAELIAGLYPPDIA